MDRNKVIEAARSCLGVRWLHQGREPKLGLDCIGLPMWAYAQAGWAPTHPVQTNTGDYRRVGTDDTLRALLGYECDFIHPAAGQTADLLLFQHLGSRFPDHVGLLIVENGKRRMIHCTAEGSRCVVEHALSREWESRLVGIYRLFVWGQGIG